MPQASMRHQPLVRTLLDHGAQINAANRRGGTALTLASARGFETVVVALLAYDADKKSPTFASAGLTGRLLASKSVTRR